MMSIIISSYSKARHSVKYDPYVQSWTPAAFRSWCLTVNECFFSELPILGIHSCNKVSHIWLGGLPSVWWTISILWHLASSLSHRPDWDQWSPWWCGNIQNRDCFSCLYYPVASILLNFSMPSLSVLDAYSRWRGQIFHDSCSKTARIISKL